MKKSLVIQSISDLITNSSSEVFLFENSDGLDKYFDEHKFFGGIATSFKTIDDVAKYVLDDRHDFEPLELLDCVKWTGVGWEELYRNLIEYKKPEEIFDFFKFKFEDLVGKTIVTLDNNYSQELLDNMSIYEKTNNVDINLIDRDSY